MTSRRWRNCSHSQLHFSDTQIGTLNAIYSLPNIFLVDGGRRPGGPLQRARHGARDDRDLPPGCHAHRPAATHFPVMAAGRLLFGIGAETLVVAVLVALYEWFSSGRYFALQMSLNLSLARMGSYFADRSTALRQRTLRSGLAAAPVARGRLCRGLAAGGALVYFYTDRREAARGTLAAATGAGTDRLGHLWPVSRPPTGCWSSPAWPSSRSYFRSAAPLPSSICRKHRA